MDLDALILLKQHLESAAKIDTDLAHNAGELISMRLEGAISADDACAQITGSTDSAMQLAGRAYPGWSITLSGTTTPADDAQWKCTLSERAHDDDQLVGIGHGAGIRLSLLAAITHLHIMHAQGYA